jgi:hypothetical protein
MTQSKFLLTLSFIFIATVCKAQITSSGNDTIKKNSSSHSLHLFNHYPGLFTHKTFYTGNDLYRTLNTKSWGLVPKTAYTEPCFSGLDYGRAITTTNFNYLSRPDFGYGYDPGNPYGVSNSVDGLIDGSLDYLLWKIFRDN